MILRKLKNSLYSQPNVYHSQKNPIPSIPIEANIVQEETDVADQPSFQSPRKDEEEVDPFAAARQVWSPQGYVGGNSSSTDEGKGGKGIEKDEQRDDNKESLVRQLFG